LRNYTKNKIAANITFAKKNATDGVGKSSFLVKVPPIGCFKQSINHSLVHYSILTKVECFYVAMHQTNITTLITTQNNKRTVQLILTWPAFLFGLTLVIFMLLK